MPQLSARYHARALPPLLALLAACANTPTAKNRAKNLPPAAAGTCGDARVVALDDVPQSGGSFGQLSGTHYAELVFTCPTDEPCSLPKDSQMELTIEPQRAVACEFAACRVAYMDSLPFAHAPDDPCPKVLWSTVRVHLKTDAGTLDEQRADVNVLASARGEAFVRFLIDSPPSLLGSRALERATNAHAHPAAAQRAILLDIQLELTADGLRGQLSALAAPLPSEPASELRFSALWTATWESPTKARGKP